MGIKGQEKGRTLCSKYTAFLYEFRDASNQPTFPSLMVSHDHFRLGNILLLNWWAAFGRTLSFWGMEEQEVDISLWTLSLQEFFVGKGVASREAEIFFFNHKDTNCRSRNKENNEKTKTKFCSIDNFWMLIKWPRNSLRCQKKWRKPLMAEILLKGK